MQVFRRGLHFEIAHLPLQRVHLVCIAPIRAKVGMKMHSAAGNRIGIVEPTAPETILPLRWSALEPPHQPIPRRSGSESQFRGIQLTKKRE